MKAILEFNLPEDTHEHETCLNGYRYHNALYEFDQLLRQKIKYGDCSDEVYDIYLKLREDLHEIIDDNNVKLDM